MYLPGTLYTFLLFSDVPLLGSPPNSRCWLGLTEAQNGAAAFERIALYYIGGFQKLGVLLVGVLIITDHFSGAYIRVPDVWKLPYTVISLGIPFIFIII